MKISSGIQVYKLVNLRDKTSKPYFRHSKAAEQIKVLDKHDSFGELKIFADEYRQNGKACL